MCQTKSKNETVRELNLSYSCHNENSNSALEFLRTMYYIFFVFKLIFGKLSFVMELKMFQDLLVIRITSFHFLHCELQVLLWCYIHSKTYIYMRLVLLLQTCSKNRILQYFIRNLITKQGFESKNGLFVMAVRYCLTLNAFVNFFFQGQTHP